VNHSQWRKLIRDRERVNECFTWYHLTRADRDKRPLDGLFRFVILSAIHLSLELSKRLWICVKCWDGYALMQETVV